MSGLGPRWSINPLRLLGSLTLYLILHLLHYPGLLYQSSNILDGQGCYHPANISPKAVLKFLASPLLIKRQSIEVTEVLELLSIFCHRLPSLGQLEEFHLLGISNVVWEIFREEFPPKGLPRHRLASLFHHGICADPLVLSLSGEHVYRESQPVLCWTCFCIKDPLQILQPLVCCVRARLLVELHGDGVSGSLPDSTP